MEENEAIEGTLYQSIVLSTMKELTSISATSFYSEQHEAPVFLFVGNFITSNELNDVKVAIDNANNEFGFANISYVLNTDNTDLEVSNGSIYIPNLFVIPTNPAIYYIWNGNCYYSLSLEECKETAKDSIISFFKEIYVN